MDSNESFKLTFEDKKLTIGPGMTMLLGVMIGLFIGSKYFTYGTIVIGFSFLYGGITIPFSEGLMNGVKIVLCFLGIIVWIFSFIRIACGI